MCINRRFQPKYFRHYTDVNALLGILEGGLRLSKPKKSWDDLNDYYTVQKYAEYINKDVFVLCLCESLGNAHHWYYYGYSHDGFENIYKNIKCNIKLNGSKLRSILNKRGLTPQKMIYAITNEKASLNKHPKLQTLKRVFKNMNNLPYLKRAEYRVEKEWRVISEVNKAENCKIDNSPEPIEIKDCIESITLLADEHSCIYCLIEKEITSMYPQLRGKVKSSGVHISERWHNEIEKIINEKLNKQ